ncbi:hypothetical protein MOBT1_001565 [Malassezia obtusa]|uniref:Uncharacterized protein n=1 Tax=Malassezia obtusa TaxID=76774 RepID=A0AAF0E4D3_9BASI|nr:hypothetical protein MOBT1_001565 [Malassezia obtusa]
MVLGGPLRANFASSGSTLSLGAPASGAGSAEKGTPPAPSLGLHRAAGTGNVALVLYALENGQPPNDMLHGVAPLHVAACVGDVVATQLLIAFGADVNLPRARSRAGTTPGVEGSTALHFAAANGHYAVACVLLENGARPAPSDRDGQTPESLARANQHAACADLVRRCAETYGAQGHVEPDSVRELGYAAPWGDAILSPTSRESSPETVRAPRERVPLAPPAGAGRASAAPLSIRTDVYEAPQRSSTASPVPSDTRRRPSLPFFLEKAAHPASSLRALWPQGHAAPALPPPRDDGEELAGGGLRVPRISSRTGLSSLLKRATGSGYPRTPEESHTPVLRDEGDSSRFSGILSPTALLSLVQRRSQENLSRASSNDASEPPSLSASPTSDSASARSTQRPRETALLRPEASGSKLRLRRTELPPHAGAASLRASALALPALPTRTRRLRSSSASGARPSQAWDEAPDAGRPHATRARASSEVQPPPPPGARGDSDEVVRHILDRGPVLGDAPDAQGHSSLAVLLAQYGASLQRDRGP